MTNTINMNMDSLRRAYLDKQLSPELLVDHCLEIINQDLTSNAWITVLTRDQLEPYLQALSEKEINEHPLWGIPFGIKDNIDLAGIPTTAGCPDFAYTPNKHAFVVEQLIQAGAIPIGKTNLDQFATGLNGTRSPYGPVSNAFKPDYISGGSSAGASFAVAKGQVSFSLGTDTAGSGRVPAAFNNLIGTKPSLGLVSSNGVVPACLSLDCVTFFTSTQNDANLLLKVASVYDKDFVYARKPEFSQKQLGTHFRIGVPKEEDLEFFGNPDYLSLFKQACEQLRLAGATMVQIDCKPFIDAAKLLYHGPWVAERYHAVGQFIDNNPGKADPSVATIIQGGKKPSAVDAFHGMYRLKACKAAADEIVESVDAIVMPTTTNHYTIAEMQDNPIELNNRLGYYTNFMNLLDYSALAIPAGFASTGLPFGITLFAAALEDSVLQTISERYLRIKNWGMGATGQAMPTVAKPNPKSLEGYINVAVCGAHLKGMPLNPQLTTRNSLLIESTFTSANYQFYALAGGPPFRPGLKRASKEEKGESIFVEVWAVPEEHFGSFVAGIPAPLGIGKLELTDGRWVSGFICEPYGLEDAKEITELQDWRVYIASL